MEGSDLKTVLDRIGQHVQDETRSTHLTHGFYNLGTWLEAVGVGKLLREERVNTELLPPECFEWARRWEQGARMMIAGNVGSGKTVAAVWCLCAAWDSKLKYRTTSPGAWFLTQDEYYDAVFSGNRSKLERADSVPALVIDDCGAAYESERPLSKLEGLINRRHINRRATILTTNLNPHPKEVPDGRSFAEVAPRAYDRLRDEPGPGIVILDRPSMRGNS